MFQILAAVGERCEDDRDTALFQELTRVLKVGGKVVVIPLYMCSTPGAFTDPRWSVPANVAFDEGATISGATGMDGCIRPTL